MAVRLPRPHPDGGWFCEYGTAHGEGCTARAVWVLASCADNPGERPGAVYCTEHANLHHRFFQVHYVPLLCVVPAGTEGGER